ncbi:MAG TPA: 2-oxo acid dehydrogenase subunit E2 [Elusimicrobiota bacterium]|nr:2-oxo acid dehydrogenase subunit E2 [Elusimicrobiota bacterium]
MNYEFKLPDIGEGLVEGEIVKWFVKVGDTVAEHQPLASILTDKAEVEIPSPKAGKVVKLFGKPGEKVKVHAPLVAFDVKGGGDSHEEPVAAPAAASPVKSNGKAAKVEKPSAAAKAAVAEAPKPAAAPAAGGTFVFALPDIGEGLVEGELVKWHVKAGGSVTEHQPIAAVLTDKAEVEIPSPKTGKIQTLHAKPGEKVKVHSPLVTFSGVAGGKAAPAAPEAPAAKTAALEERAAADAPVAPARPAQRQTDVSASPMVRKLAKDSGVDITLVAGTGPQGRILESDVRGFKGNAGSPASRVKATPAVRALAASAGVDLAAIKGTGPGGRVVEGDVRAAAPKADRRKGAAAPAPLTFTPAGAASSGEERIPFVGIRRKIAERMQFSKRTVAHVTHMDECDMTAVLALRDELKPEAAARGVKLTFLPFIIKALTKTLAEFPAFNASLAEEAGEIVIKRYYNVGIAVSAPQGLVVPNIKGADGKDLFGLAAEVSGLAEKVRTNKIDVASLQGGTITITNIGPIGGLFATPIVNHPEVAILGIMKLQKRPVYRDGGIMIRDMMNLVLSFDHRVTDGADAAQFMNTLIRRLENPRTLV